LRWRLFDFGKVKAEIAQARGVYAEALVAYRQTALKATEDIENAMMKLAQSQARLEQLQDEVESLTRARDLSQRAYQAGAITLTDVLDADRQLLVARNEVESTRAESARAAVGTFRALGGGWPRGTPEKRPMRDSSKPANEIRQDKVVITHGRASRQRKTSPGSAMIGYSDRTWAEDMAPQGCDQSADPAAGNAWAAQAAFAAFLAEKR
jgi:hypothetical protein